MQNLNMEEKLQKHFPNVKMSISVVINHQQYCLRIHILIIRFLACFGTEHLLVTKILEVNLFAFAYRLFHEDFSPIYVSKQMQIN